MFCVDSVDAESWYNRDVPPRWRIARHVQYENYVMEEVLPFIRLQQLRPASRFSRLQLWRLSRGQHRAAPSRPLYGIPLHERRVRPEQFPRRLLRPGCLLQHAAALSCRTLAIRGFSIGIGTTPTSSRVVGTTIALGRARTWRASWARKASHFISTSGTRGTAMIGRPGRG